MIKNLKYLRNREKVSQQQLAEVIGISQQSVNKYENHNIEPDISTLIKIADYFNTSVDFLIGNTDIDHKSEKVESCDLNEEELSLVQAYRKLNEGKRYSVRLIIENYLN